jgi:hypothetical protein
MSALQRQYGGTLHGWIK